MRLTGRMSNDKMYAEVVFLNPDGSQQRAAPGWVERKLLGRPSLAPNTLKWGKRTLALDDVGLRILTEAPCKAGYCAATYEAAGGAPGGHAYQYVHSLKRHPGFTQVPEGSKLQAGDVCVWLHYGRNPGTKGWKFGHIGVVGLDASTGTPYLISNFDGRRDVRPIVDNGYLYIYRPRR